MDRNVSYSLPTLKLIAVALRKESVDRNEWIKEKYPGCRLSLSARRAWIEICGGASARLLALVALRKESVDRNLNQG